MPLTDAQRAQIIESSFGHFGDKGAGDTWGISRIIMRKLGITDGGDGIRVHNVVQQAKRSWEQAAEARTDDPNTVYTPTFRDPSLFGSENEYRYRVILEIVDPATLQRYTTLEIVDSLAPLTPAAAVELAKQQHRNASPTEGSDPRRRQISQEADVQGTLIGIGRR